MSKKVRIPSHMMPLFMCNVNGRKYIYPAGTIQEVPDDVASVIENFWEMKPAQEVADQTIVSTVEPAEEDIPKVFFGAALPQTKNDLVMSFRYISKTEDISGYCKTKAQGNSSMGYPKKNQTVKLYKDADCAEKLEVDFKGWGKQHKFCFKANWIDLTHARNIVSARLWGDVVKSRADYEMLPEDLRNSPNQGAVDGFPVKVYADGIYQGRYTLNIPKDAWMANMEEEQEANCILCGENYVSGCFRAEAKIDETDWTDEVHKTVPAAIKNRWNDTIRFVMNSSDEEFVEGIGHYFDIPSLIDYYIFGVVTCNNDGFGKNQLYMTWDGMKWYATVYDLDNTFGTYLGSVKPYDFPRESYEDYKNGGGNLLYVRLENLFKEDIYARWEELKDGALSVENIINRFERFTDIAPRSLVEEDYAATTAGGAFTEIPLKAESNIQQIREFIRNRHAWATEWFADSVSEDVILYRNFNPNGATFCTETAIDWDTQYIEASIDLSTMPADGANRILFSVGQDVSVWNGGVPNFHVYYLQGSHSLNVGFFNNYSQYGNMVYTLDDTKIVIRLDKNGAHLNGELLAPYEDYRKGYYEDALAQLTALNTVQVGGMASTAMSCATYEYIAVKNANSGAGPTPVVYLDSATIVSGSTMWEDKASGSAFSLTGGTSNVNENGLLMTSSRAVSNSPVSLNGAFSYYLEVYPELPESYQGTANVFFSFNKESATKYADQIRNWGLRINSYAGDFDIPNSTVPFVNNKMHQFAVVRDVEGDSRVYLGNTLVGSFARGTFEAVGDFDIVVGASSWNNYPIDRSSFRIKSLRIFDYALTEEEVTALMMA